MNADRQPHVKSRLWLNSDFRLFLIPCILCVLALLAACGPAAQTAKQEYMFWPPSPETPHIQFLTSISSTAQVLKGQSSMDTLLYGKETVADMPFVRPFGIRFVNGCIYTCDASSGNLSVLDLRKKQVRLLGKSGDITLIKPIDVAIAPDGIKYVADTYRSAVLAYDASDKYAGRIGGPGSSVPKLRPVALEVHGDELFVADFFGACIRVFDRFSGKQLRTYGPELSTKKVGGTTGVAIDSQGNIYMSDFLGCMVHKLTPEGKVIYSVGSQGDRAGNFVRPKHLAVDKEGILYVVDNAFENVQMFNDKGQTLMYFGASGTHPGAMQAPAGICISETDFDLFQQYVHPDFQMQRLIFVTNNTGNYRINVYAMGTLKPGKTVADLNASRKNIVVGIDTRPPTTLPAIDETGVEPETPASQPATAPAPATTKPHEEVPGAKPF